ncbi:MAG: hypothetical protein B7X29_06945 [Halothiobacillus sp. 13-55-115]|nr:MAG: hypothetical protein B7X29_06945 [Halothiobacillus sp. 13-55-115]
MDTLMNTAQQHALEQANLITQLIKYADRIILVESASEPERRALVKLLDDQLPDHIDILGLRASPTTTPSAIITLVTEALQLSPGIESPQELATAAHEALTASERILVIIENAHAWLNTPQWSEMVSYLRAAHDYAPNQLLFLLTGDIGLTDQLRLEPELSEMQSDMHPAAATTQPLFVDEPEAGNRFIPSDHLTPTKRFSPTLLIAAGISVAIIAFGGFALLTRSTDQPNTTQTLALKTDSGTTSTPPTPDSSAPAQADNPLPNDGSISASDTQGSQAPAEMATPPATIAPAPSQNNAPEPAMTQTPRVNPSPETTAPETAKPAEKTATSTAGETPHLIPPKPEKPVEQATATKPTEKIAPNPVKAPIPVTKHSKPESEAKPVVVKGVDNAWYRARTPKRAALQIGAFNDEKTALDFISKQAAHAPVSEWHVFSQKMGNKVLYTVTAGDFSSIDAARQTVSRLPAALQKLKPYPRSFASIREAISTVSSGK